MSMLTTTQDMNQNIGKISSGSANLAIVDSMWPKNPDESIYFVMYRLGLKKIPLSVITSFAESRGKILRGKDVEQWQRGFAKADPFAIPDDRPHGIYKVEDYPLLEQPWDPVDRYIPAIDPGHVLTRWGTVRHTLEEAKSYRNVQLIGENLRGCHYVVLDIDGDHDGTPDIAVINYWAPWINQTKAKVKWEAGVPVSFHLEFKTDRAIPTMHFRKVDLLGNSGNQARWLKPNKKDNCLLRADLTEVWGDLIEYVQRN